MGFTKLDEGILKSSIMAEDSDTFKVWIALLASCDRDGLARVSAIFLSSVCHLPIEVVEKALDILSSPDKHSRSDEEEGKRTQRVDGGYFLINYGKYREFTYSQSPEAIRKREYRKKKKEEGDMMGHDGTSPGHSASASSSASSLKRGSKEGEKGRYTPIFEEFWSIYPRKREKKDAFSKWKELTKAQKDEVILATPNYAEEMKINEIESNFIKLPKTFLNPKKERWKDFLPENWKKPKEKETYQEYMERMKQEEGEE